MLEKLPASILRATSSFQISPPSALPKGRTLRQTTHRNQLSALHHNSKLRIYCMLHGIPAQADCYQLYGRNFAYVLKARANELIITNPVREFVLSNTTGEAQANQILQNSLTSSHSSSLSLGLIRFTATSRGAVSALLGVNLARATIA